MDIIEFILVILVSFFTCFCIAYTIIHFLVLLDNKFRGQKK